MTDATQTDVTQQPNADEDFASAFAQFTKPDDAPAPAPTPKPEPTNAETDKAAPAAGAADEGGELPASTAGSDGEGAGEGGEGGEAPAAQAPEAKKAAQQAEQQQRMTEEEILQRFAKIVKETPTEPQQQQQPQQTQQVPDYSQEEVQLLNAYEKDWSDVSRAESLKRRAEYRHLTQYIFDQFMQQFAPLADMVNTLASRTHVNDLHTAVEDYDDLRDKVVNWALSEDQPAYLRAAYSHVIQNGSVEEIKDLVGRYRAATGTAGGGAQGAQMTTGQPAKAKGTELPAAAKQAAASLAPVSSKRTAVVQQVSKENFDDAFAQFAKET